MKHRKGLAYLLAIGMTLALSACGGGGGGSSSAPSLAGPATGGTGSTGGSPVPVSAVGTIDRFGSIFVNGVEFETDSAEYEVDDETAFDDSALSVGMVVKVEGTDNGDGTGNAMKVHYDDDLEGPIADLATDPDDSAVKTFTIFGESVGVRDGETVFKSENDPSFGFDTLQNGDHVEVSGQRHEGILWASFVKEEDDQDDDFEAKGTISNFDNVDRFTLTLMGGSTLEVTVAAGARIPAGGIMDGQFVEVEGTIPDPVNAPTEFVALKIEIEDEDDFDDDDDENEIEIEGILSFDGSVWSVRDNELTFDANTVYLPATLESDIADGSADGRRVEVKGERVSDAVLVERIKYEDGDDGNELEIKGMVESIDPDDATTAGTLTVSFSPATGTIPVVIDSSTMFLNDDSMSPFDLSDLIPGTSFVEIKAHLDANGDIVADALEREDSPDEYEIEGPLDPGGFTAGVSVSVLGVTFFVDALTEYEDGMPVDGDIVDVEDENLDGTAESVDIED